MRKRAVPAAGVYLSLTQRCPMHCAHCLSDSTPSSQQHSGSIFLSFLRSFTQDNRPDFVLLTGGEPLLRPKLIVQLAEIAHERGSTVCLTSGMYFANRNPIPKQIERAIRSIDLMTISIDEFHEREVPRAAVFRAARIIQSLGVEIHFQVVGRDKGDPYLSGVMGSIEAEFGRHVPAFVGQIGSKGRARSWIENSDTINAMSSDGCDSVTWPVVSYDGAVVACCNQDVVDGPRPEHLYLGKAGEDSWEIIRNKVLSEIILRALRTYGPRWLNEIYGSGEQTCTGYCETCLTALASPFIKETLGAVPKERLNVIFDLLRTWQGGERNPNLSGYEDWLMVETP